MLLLSGGCAKGGKNENIDPDSGYAMLESIRGLSTVVNMQCVLKLTVHKVKWFFFSYFGKMTILFGPFGYATTNVQIGKGVI